MSVKSEEPWRQIQRKWEAEHPGHCGLCGLPRRWCIHTKASYNEEVMKFVRDRKITEAHHVKVRAYTEALSGIPYEKLLEIPRPPKNWQAEVLWKFLSNQGQPTSHFWRTLLSDNVL